MTGLPPARPPRAQVIALVLAALLPVIWLVGRRTAPAVRPVPLIVRPDDGPILLPEGRGGVSSRGPTISLGADSGGSRGVRLAIPAAPRRDGPARLRVRLVGPGGDDLWQATWEPAGTAPERLEIVVPREILAPGRHALRVDDERGEARIFAFVVP